MFLMSRMANPPCAKAAFADSRGNGAEHSSTNQHQHQHQPYIEASRVTTSGSRNSHIETIPKQFHLFASALCCDVRVDSGQMRDWRQARTSTKPTMTTSIRIHPSEDIPHPQLSKVYYVTLQWLLQLCEECQEPCLN